MTSLSVLSSVTYCSAHRRRGPPGKNVLRTSEFQPSAPTSHLAPVLLSAPGAHGIAVVLPDDAHGGPLVQVASFLHRPVQQSAQEQGPVQNVALGCRLQLQAAGPVLYRPAISRMSPPPARGGKGRRRPVGSPPLRTCDDSGRSCGPASPGRARSVFPRSSGRGRRPRTLPPDRRPAPARQGFLWPIPPDTLICSTKEYPVSKPRKAMKYR